MGQSSSLEAGDVGGGRTGPVGPGGAAVGYRPSATLPFAAEFRRQASRRRTQLALGFMVLLPLIILIAFQFDSGDDDNGRNEFASLVDLATSGGLNFTLFSIFVSASFLLVVVVALFCGDEAESREYLESNLGRREVAADLSTAHQLGVTSVPTFVLAGKYGVTGAQEPETLLAALREVEHRESAA